MYDREETNTTPTAYFDSRLGDRYLKMTPINDSMAVSIRDPPSPTSPALKMKPMFGQPSPKKFELRIGNQVS